MKRERYLVEVGVVGNLPELVQSADHQRIRVHDVDRPAIDEQSELVGHELFTGADRDRAAFPDAGEGIGIEHRDGILEPGQRQRRQGLGEADRAVDIVAPVAVERDLDVRPDRFADDRKAFKRRADLIITGGPIPRIATQFGSDPFRVELEVAEAFGQHPFGERPPGRVVRRVGHSAAVEVDPDVLAKGTPEQGVDRHAQRLAGEIAERHLDPADGPSDRSRLGRGRAHLRVEGRQAAVQHGPNEWTDREWVPTEQPLSTVGDGLPVAHHPRRLTQSVHARAGIDPDEQQRPGARRTTHAVWIRSGKPHRADVGHLHPGLPSGARRPAPCVVSA